MKLLKSTKFYAYVDTIKSKLEAFENSIKFFNPRFITNIAKEKYTCKMKKCT